MGFGRGILEPPRRTYWISNKSKGGKGFPDAYRLGLPFGLVVAQGQLQSDALVVVPGGTPAFHIDVVDDQVAFPHDQNPFDIVPRFGDIEVATARTVLSDARDLLVQTAYERTAVRMSNGRIIRANSPMLECREERSGFWSDPAIRARTPRKFIHVGRTSKAEELLGAPILRPLYQASNWDGRLESLDSDGYVIISARATDNSQHVILVGGNDYGTYYAVATFLREFAGARWIFPGALGTAIPRSRDFDLGETFYILDEPDYRGRSLVGMVDGSNPPLDASMVDRDWFLRNTHSPEDVNDTRNWLLRNRMHTADERRILFAKRPVPSTVTPTNTADHPANARCQTLSVQKRKFLRVESRIPVGHGLSRFFSPYLPSGDPNSPGRTMQRVQALLDMYPDSRPSIPPNSTFSGVGRQPALSGQNFCATFTTPAIDCAPRMLCACPIEAQPQTLELTPRATCAPAIASEQIKGFKSRFSDIRTVESNQRFIPITTRETHHQASIPNEGWTPCLFSTPLVSTTSLRSPENPLFENPLAEFRQTVAADLANSLIASNVAHHEAWGSVDREFSDSLGVDDGDKFWCECTPCRSTNSTDGGGVAVYKGFTFLIDLVRPETLNPELWLCQNPARVPEQARLARQVLLEAHNALQMSGSAAALALDSELGLHSIPADSPGGVGALVAFMDRMALRGVLPERARLSTHTRRLLVLMNRTCLILGTTARRDGGPAAVHPEHTLLTFLTYLDYTAPPIFESDPEMQPGNFYQSSSSSPSVRAEQFFQGSDQAQRLTVNVLHPFLTPMISSSHDLFEYEDDLFRQTRDMGAFAQHRIAPEQLNHRRWSLIANQTGIYEWMYGRTTLAPRLYTRRLRNALQGAYERYKARVFLAEAEPHMGLDGVKFHELAQLLWNVGTRLHSIRADYCQALFGPDEQVVAPMRRYFDLLELAWCNRESNRTIVGAPLDSSGAPGATVEEVPDPWPREHRYSSGFVYGTYLGFGILGRSGWLTELEPFMRIPTRNDASPDEPRETYFMSIWSAIQEAFIASQNVPDPAVKERVQYFRRAIGLIGEMIRIFRPILNAWKLIERSVNFLAADPLEWAYRSPSDLTINNVAAAWIHRDDRLRLGEALARAPWVQSANFKTDVREPIHRYMMNNMLTITGLGSELGLGLGSLVEGRMELDAAARGAMRHAFYLRYIRQYVAWWNRPGTRADMRAPADADAEGEGGVGATWFLNTKKMIAAMMIIAAQPALGTAVTPRFSAGQVGAFLRDA